MYMVLSQKHEKILEILKVNPFIQQKELAEIIGLSRPATANLLSQLVEEGFLLGKAYIVNESRYELIVCVGGANVDCKLTLEEKVQLHTSNPVVEVVSVGGVVRNIAENLGRLGRKVSLMSIIGNDEDGRLLSEQSSPFMSMNNTLMVHDERTGRYTAVIQKDGDLIIGLANMSICEKMDNNWIDINRSHLVSAKFVVTDTNITKSAFEQLLTIAKESQIHLIICGVSAPKTSRIPDDISGVYLVIFNLDESQAYLKTEETDLKKIINLWFEKGVKNVIVTNSTKGIGYGHQGKIKIVEPHRAKKVVDVTGAGDSFTSGVIYGLSKDLPFEEAIEYGKLISLLTVQTSDSVRKDLSSKLIEREMENIRK